MDSQVCFFGEYEPKGSQTYLLDTNILMYLFSPIASYGEKKQELVSTFLRQSQNVNAGLVTTALIIGEFFHVNLNIYFANWSRQQGGASYDLKKDYRGSDDFNDSIKAITSSVDSILKITDKFADNFNSINVKETLSHCFNSEFTDSYLLELSNQKAWIIVSNDHDLIDHPHRKMPILTFK